VNRRSGRDFANFAVVPDDHRQTATAKFGAFFLRVARRCASDATRASGDILLSGIGFRPLAAFVFIKLLKDCFG
jgi:hypothetical protein